MPEDDFIAFSIVCDPSKWIDDFDSLRVEEFAAKLFAQNREGNHAAQDKTPGAG